MRFALLFVAVAALAQTPAQTPDGVLDTLRTAAQALTEQKPDVFLDQFDRAMPGYGDLAANVVALTIKGQVNSTLEIAREEGDASRREINIDWFLRVGAQAPKRSVLKLVLERRGRKWVIVGIDRPEFFKP